MVLLTVIAFVVALLSGGFIVGRRLGLGRTRYADDKPQRFHVGEISRLGGVAVGLGLSAAWLLGAMIDGKLVPLNLHLDLWYVMVWLLVLAPGFVVGQMEDMTQRLSVRYRLSATLLSGVLAWLFLGATVPRIGIGFMDLWLFSYPTLGALLAVAAIAGLPHAFNIIDGYNGLAGTVALLVCLAVAHVALQVGDRAMAAQMMALAGATGGFLFWNYPRGLIFAGDGGSYLWGGVIALACVTLVARHATVSPWFPALLLIYPVWETIFSIYRKSVRGGSPSVADALHFHQLIYRRLVRRVIHDDHARQILMRNNRTSPYLWGFTALTVFPAVLFWQNTLVLMFFCGLFVVTYVLAYLAIVRFKVPGWLRR